MDIIEIIENKAYYYDLSHTYFGQLNQKDFIEDLQVPLSEIRNESISLLLDHDFIHTPSIQVRLELLQDLLTIGTYTLYIDDLGNVVDQFLVIE